MKYLKIIFALILFTGGTTVYGQNVGDLMKKAKAMGLSESDIQNQLKNSGISGVSGVGSVADVADDNEIDPFMMMDAVDREASMIENMAFSQEEHVRMRDSLSRVVFGREIFSIKSLSFEPAYNIATPVDYRLGPGDEIVLDVWGQSEANYRQKISPEGTITIKDVGVIYLGGLSVESARDKIKQTFATVYEGIDNGTVRVEMSLGEIRTIKEIGRASCRERV